MNITDESGWLFQGDTTHTQELSESDLEKLLELAELDDKWAENVRNEVSYYDAHPSGAGAELFLNQFRIMNTGGTIVQYPFGYICTFPSRRHLFRGEPQEYIHSEASLSRRCRDRSGNRYLHKERELLHVISNMRIAQFRKFIWQFDIIPQWEGKLSEVNYKALAQHYGFETFLLDLTNNVRDALFFATCKWVNDHYEPLAQRDIDKSDAARYGILYHSPDWCLDYMNGANIFKLQASFEKEKDRTSPSVIDTGLWDGVAYQIGLQPFYRAHSQFGYVYPMKTLDDIRCSKQFERLKFRQTVDFSKRIYDRMDGGKKIYPEEGINAVADLLAKMQRALIFSEDDLLWAYELDEADRRIFPDVSCLKEALLSEDTARLLADVYGECDKLTIQENEVPYPISRDTKDYINSQYNDRSFLEPVGGVLHDTFETRRYRRERYRQIFGEYPD